MKGPAQWVSGRPVVLGCLAAPRSSFLFRLVAHLLHLHAPMRRSARALCMSLSRPTPNPPHGHHQNTHAHEHIARTLHLHTCVLPPRVLQDMYLARRAMMLGEEPPPDPLDLAVPRSQVRATRRRLNGRAAAALPSDPHPLLHACLLSRTPERRRRLAGSPTKPGTRCARSFPLAGAVWAVNQRERFLPHPAGGARTQEARQRRRHCAHGGQAGGA